MLIRGSHRRKRQRMRFGWLVVLHAAFECEAGAPTLSGSPDAAADPAAQPVTLYLDLTVNGEPTARVIPVRQSESDLQLRVGDLRTAGVIASALSASDDVWLTLGELPNVGHRYDPNALLLELTFPPDWFAGQRLDAGRGTVSAPVSSTGLAINYSVHLSDSDDGARHGSLWSEWRAFGASGVLSQTGAYRSAHTGAGWLHGATRREGYVRFDTSWSSTDETQLHAWTVGDLITSSQAWSPAVRLAGVKLSKDFRLRPDLVTYPLPEFSGQAALPSTLDLFINGQHVRAEQIRPGPYTMTVPSLVFGAGEATLVTTDTLGREIVTTMPFYASSELLRAGLADYSFSFGALRRQYGIESFSYGRFAATGSLRYGATNALTLEGQADVSPTANGGFGLLGFGVVAKAPTMRGVLNGSVSHSVREGIHGWHYSFGYRYTHRGLSFSYQGSGSTSGFRTLADAHAIERSGISRSHILTAGTSTPRFGSASISYLRVRPFDREVTRFANLSWVKHILGGVSFHLGVNRDLQRDEETFTAQFLATFGRAGNVTVGSRRGADSLEYLQYVRSTPSHGGVGWNASLVRRESDSLLGNASVAWSNRHARVEIGTSSTHAARTRWADAQGSLLMMEGEIFPARQVSDAFVVISTNGLEGIPVRYENQLIGYTNRRGRLLVPSVSSHYEARFRIDPSKLPADVTLADTEQRLVVRRRSGAVLSFDVQRTQGVLIRIVDRESEILPVGSLARDERSQRTGVVGYDGLVYFEGLSSPARISVQRPDGTQCSLEARWTETAGALTQIGPFVCEPTS